MTTEPNDVVRRLVQLAQPGAPGHEPHVDPEELALFVAGQLTDTTPLVAHLADCEECRTWASALLKQQAEATPSHAIEPAQAQQRARSASSTRIWQVLAASVLLSAALATWYVNGDSRRAEVVAYREAETQLLAQDFEATLQTARAAEARGVRSDRLRSLEAQAIRKIPNPNSLAEAGRLTDFGFALDGAVAREPNSAPFRTGLAAAREKLGDQSSQEVQLLLNRGHLKLVSGEYESARSDFLAALQLAPDNVSGSLGLGLTEFLRENYAAAEVHFSRALVQQPENLAATINLAMTFQEQGNRAAALKTWQAALANPALSAADRSQIMALVKRLEESPS